MNLDHEKALDAAIDRELKLLSDLAAPPTLASKVMAAIGKRASLPWYRQAWQRWPVPWQAVSLATLAALFGAICFGVWELAHWPVLTAAAGRAGVWFSGLSALSNVLNVVLGALLLVLKKLGSGFVIGSIVAFALGYALFAGLGTVYVRLAFARR